MHWRTARRFGVLAAALSICAGCEYVRVGRVARTPPAVPHDATSATVAYVIDGDTLMLRTNRWENTRLLGIDAPEIKHRRDCYGEEAKAELARLLPRQSQVWLRHDRQLRDRFDRDLSYVWNAQGLFVNLEMVRRGFARTLFVKPNFGHFKEIRAAQDEAERAGAGLWSACKGEP